MGCLQSSQSLLSGSFCSFAISWTGTKTMPVSAAQILRRVIKAKRKWNEPRKERRAATKNHCSTNTIVRLIHQIFKCEKDIKVCTNHWAYYICNEIWNIFYLLHLWVGGKMGTELWCKNKMILSLEFIYHIDDLNLRLFRLLPSKIEIVKWKIISVY